ncbi:MAG: ABC transporter substrate-binding protein [Chitinophagales bacterium]
MKKVLVVLLILITSLTFMGCGKEKESDKVQKSAPQKTLTIGIMPDIESIPFVIAEKNGYFAKEGVKVKIEHFKSARDRDSALQSGQLDGVVTDMVAVVFANKGGIQLRMISRSEGNIPLMAGKDSGIATIKDLKGKTVGLSTNTIMDYTTDSMLKSAQLKPEDIKKTAIPQLPARLEMLQAGKLDAAIMPDPLAALAVKNGATILASTDEMNNKAGAIAFTADSMKKYPTEVKAVFKAYNDAVAYLNEEPAENYIDYVIKAQGFPAGVKDCLKLPVYNKATAPDSKVFEDVVKWMQDKKLIDQKYEYKALVDDKVLR